ncbi:MAG: nucleotidyltransferase family protein [Bacillota bacterium]|nr:nucleotidyltransferase family protein [Bacillota bacterium]
MIIHGLIVAAGLSSRAKGYKMTYKFSDLTLIERSVLSFKPFCEKVYVVVGFNHILIRDILKKYDFVEILHNKNYKEGMFNSVKLGISNMKCDKLLFMPGDYPSIKKSTIEDLLLVEGDVVIPSYNFHAGHPIVIDGKLLSEITENLKFSTLKDFVKSKEVQYVNVSDKGVLIDIDTLEDYKNVLESLKNEN